MKKLSLVILMLCVSYTTPSVIVRQNDHIERLGIYLESGEHDALLVTNQFDAALDNFIEAYNVRPDRPFELFRAQANDSSTLRIKLVTTRLVPQSDLTAALIVSIIGLSIPFMMVAAD